MACARYSAATAASAPALASSPGPAVPGRSTAVPAPTSSTSTLIKTRHTPSRCSRPPADSTNPAGQDPAPPSPARQAAPPQLHCAPSAYQAGWLRDTPVAQPPRPPNQPAHSLTGVAARWITKAVGMRRPPSPRVLTARLPLDRSVGGRKGKLVQLRRWPPTVAETGQPGGKSWVRLYREGSRRPGSRPASRQSKPATRQKRKFRPSAGDA
jgi:hypothetical protein